MRPREARAGNGVGIAVPVYDSDCCVCFLCVDDCPTSAITVASSFAGRRNFRSIYDGDRPDDRTGSGR
jgi:formate hydrogenlyase subunit 6/NADH:ubiquinone oxidoreductase subunit I